MTMRKTVVISMVFLGLACLLMGASPSSEAVVVKLSASEWRDVKGDVDTNGFCRIPAQNICIVITNGLPELAVQHISTHGGNRVKETDPHGVLPYSGQGL